MRVPIAIYEYLNTIFRNQFLKKSQIFTHAVIGRDVINIEFARNTTLYYVYMYIYTQEI